MNKALNRRRFKTPSRRRAKKWRTRIEKMCIRAKAKGNRWFLGEMFRVMPLIDAAERAGVNLLERFGPLGPATPQEINAFFGLTDYALIEEFATQKNLEI